MASEHRGQVTFNGLPMPGATVTATQGSKTVTTVSDQDGNYFFPDLPDGKWKISVKMTGFVTTEIDLTIAPSADAATAPTPKWELKMLPLDEMIAQTRIVKADAPPIVATVAPGTAPKADAPKPAETAEAPKPAEESQSSDGFLVNGSVNNAATSQFSLAQGFGNTRKGSKGLYNYGLSLVLDNSALDARPYSLTGLDTPQPNRNKVTAGASFGGPIKIPRLMPRGPNFFVVYQWTRDRVATALSGLVPTAAQRSGNLPTGTIAVSPQAQALLALYPLPNLAGNANYNYQVPVLSNSHSDAMQMRLDKSVTRRDNVYGGFSFQSIRADNSNLFAFRDSTNTFAYNGNINWNHHLKHSIYSNLGYRTSRIRTDVTPFFANRTNVSGAAGITGNNQDPINWGPPSLSFSSGISGLSDAQSSFNRNRTEALSESMQWYHRSHNVTFGGDFRRQEYNYLSQQNPRGSFGFSSATTVKGSDIADFLSGVADSSAIAYGNADKYLRQSVYDAYVTDDWRIRPELTINAGIRWEYGAPITELKGRLVNLDVAPNFSLVSPVLGSSPSGTLTGQRYPNSLLRPDRLGIEPRIGISWRPIPGSSVVVRAGYGVYDDTSVYQATALALAQQAPLSTSLSAQYTTACPLTLQTGLIRQSCTTTTADNFAVDPNFRVGYAQTWQLAVQRDLPAALQMTATYLGIKGTRGVQEFLPNSYAIGAANPCPTCPAGFVYRTSGGNSTRESGSLQLRRRLRSGFTASALYTFSKSLDDDSVLGGQGPVATGAASQSTASAQIAQDWRNLRGERGRSTFDQRHLLTTNLQYTTGMGLGGGSLMSGWRGRAYKEWTVVGTITAGTGLPETPIYAAIVPGTGISGSIRPDRTSASVTAAPAGRFLNAAAYAAPQSGQWGNASRNSITGPSQFSFNASMSRTFRLGKTYNLDMRVDATNLLNHVVFTSYNTTVNSPLFGLASNTNSMRTLQTTARLRF